MTQGISFLLQTSCYLDMDTRQTIALCQGLLVINNINPTSVMVHNEKFKVE